MKEKLRIALIGAGSFACRYHIPNMMRREDAELVAIAKRSDKKRKEVQEYFDIPHGYANYLELLERETPDGVIICTPHDRHYEQAKTCLEREIPVLLEKPMTLDVADAYELVAIAEENDVPFLVAYNRRVDPRYRETARIIADGGIGEIRFLEGRRFENLEWLLSGELPPTEELREKHWPEEDHPNFRSAPKAIGEGFLEDGGTHMIDTLLWFSFSRPAEVNAIMHTYPSGLEVRTAVNLIFENGAIGSLSCSGDTSSVIPYETLVHGSEGAIALSKQEFLHIYKGQSMNPTPTFPPNTTTDHFIEVLNEREEILCAADTAATVVEITRAIFESARSRQTVTVSIR